MKDILTQPPILAYPDFRRPFELHTDASGKGLGAVIYQDKRVIAFASRSLNKSEQNYSAFKLEFLALKWAVTEKFKDYLAINHFTALTDNNPLTYILTTAKLDATGQRWASALGEYNFDIKYRQGRKNIDADAMSRYPHEHMQEDGDSYIKIEDQSVKAICCSSSETPYIEIIPIANINIVDVTDTPGTPMAQIEYRQIRRQQREDALIERWRRTVIDGCLPDRQQCSTREDLFMRRHFDSLKIIRGVLYRIWKEGEHITYQLVLPEVYRPDVLKGLHNEIGHPGRDRTISLLRERYFWPGMAKDTAVCITIE